MSEDPSRLLPQEPPAHGSAPGADALGGLPLRRLIHELNTPLGVILMASSMQKMQLEALQQQLPAQGSEALQEGLRELAESTELVCSSVQLGIALMQSRHRRTFGLAAQAGELNLAETVAQVVALQQARHAGIQLTADLHIPTGLRLHGELSDWHMLIGNLISNSIAHGFAGRSGGHIRIQASLQPGQGLLLQYSDDGSGISAQAQEKIFTNGFSTGLGSGHQGLGLGIVREMVQDKLGGSIRAQPSAAGALFSIELPHTLVC